MARKQPYLTLLRRPPARPVAGAELNQVERHVELLPIPTATVAIEDGKPRLIAANRSFRVTGLGQPHGPSPLMEALGERIADFLTGAAPHVDFLWQSGGIAEGRHYRVYLARIADNHGVLTLIDHTAELRTERSLRREMLTDSLTGLPNRAGFGEQLEAIADPKERARFAVLMIDLDRFSRVNACLGSMAGDELLITVARRLRGALRGADVLARTGGDEFGVLLQLDDGPDDAEHVAKRILSAFVAPFRLSSYEIRVDCSIGLSFGSEPIEQTEDLIRHAQFAMKRAKKTGRVESYQTAAFNVVRGQFGIETELRRAIDTGGLRLSFQPICDLASGAVVAFESLARWVDDSGRDISPVEFIPVAEESGLIVPLGRWAIDETMRTLAAWDRRAGGDSGVRVAVNLSPIQLQRDSVAPVVERALATHGLDGRRVTLELTESVLVSDPARVAGTMRALKELGTTLAMDDFGTGYSNLAYLQRLPIDILKIDRSFVTGMLADRDKLAIVRAILSLAQALGKQTTAEGIESNELAQTLAALGCTYGQGFVYARPLAPDEAYTLLVASRS